jgi:hypothetical protein
MIHVSTDSGTQEVRVRVPVFIGNVVRNVVENVDYYK